MKVIIDKNFYLEPDGFKGLVLVKEYTKQTKNKKGELKDKVFTDRWYYPSPLGALKKYTELTTGELDLTGLTKAYESMVGKLEKIEQQFKANNWFSKS